MPTVNYTNLGGQIIAEKRGGNRSFYGADPLGSTVALYDSSGTPTDTFSYWPYGEVRTSSGSTATPFKFCGTWGYYGDATGRLYVRARFYRDKLASWQSLDILWPTSSAYNYGNSSPAMFIDYSGENPLLIGLLIIGLIGLESANDADDHIREEIRDVACCALQAKAAMGAASRWCKKWFKGKEGAPDGTICNAFQHCMWACLTAKHCGMQMAYDCLTAHEENPPWGLSYCPPYRTVPPNGAPNPPDAKCMDLANNAIGRGCASADSCETCCEVHAKSGSLYIIEDLKSRPDRWRQGKTDCKKQRVPASPPRTR